MVGRITRIGVFFIQEILKLSKIKLRQSKTKRNLNDELYLSVQCETGALGFVSHEKQVFIVYLR